MDIYNFLQTHLIPFKRHDHPPVFTCEQANELIPDLPGTKTKNLFVRDKKGKQHFLIVVSDEKQVDLNALAKSIETSRLSMGSPERLMTHLGVEPGSVSLLALVNDTGGSVQLVLDSPIANAQALQCHPLVNTSTLVIPREGIEKLLYELNHKPLLMDVPGRTAQG